MTRVETIGECTIYALADDAGAVRYVGKTVMLLSRRLTNHLASARQLSRPKVRVTHWLRALMRRGVVPTIRALEVVPAGGDWADAERKWIERFRRDGVDLLNHTMGGEGLAGHKFTPEHRAKIAAALRRGREHACAKCGATFYRKPKDVRSTRLFCSRACSNSRSEVRHAA